MPESVIDLGRKVKAKYPDYADMSDADLGRRVKAKYPGDYDDFDDVDDEQESSTKPPALNIPGTEKLGLPSLDYVRGVQPQEHPTRGKMLLEKAKDVGRTAWETVTKPPAQGLHEALGTKNPEDATLTGVYNRASDSAAKLAEPITKPVLKFLDKDKVFNTGQTVRGAATFADELGRGLAGVGDFATSPVGVALPALSRVLPPAAHAAIGAAFAADMAEPTAEAIRDAVNDPSSRNTSKAIVQSLMMGLPLVHAGATERGNRMRSREMDGQEIIRTQRSMDEMDARVLRERVDEVAASKAVQAQRDELAAAQGIARNSRRFRNKLEPKPAPPVELPVENIPEPPAEPAPVPVAAAPQVQEAVQETQAPRVNIQPATAPIGPIFHGAESPGTHQFTTAGRNLLQFSADPNEAATYGQVSEYVPRPDAKVTKITGTADQVAKALYSGDVPNGILRVEVVDAQGNVVRSDIMGEPQFFERVNKPAGTPIKESINASVSAPVGQVDLSKYRNAKNMDWESIPPEEWKKVYEAEWNDLVNSEGLEEVANKLGYQDYLKKRLENDLTNIDSEVEFGLSRSPLVDAEQSFLYLRDELLKDESEFDARARSQVELDQRLEQKKITDRLKKEKEFAVVNLLNSRGMPYSVKENADSTYFSVEVPTGDITVRVSNHPQKTVLDRRGNQQIVGGFNEREGERHTPADYSIDPSNWNTDEVLRSLDASLGVQKSVQQPVQPVQPTRPPAPNTFIGPNKQDVPFTYRVRSAREIGTSFSPGADPAFQNRETRVGAEGSDTGVNVSSRVRINERKGDMDYRMMADSPQAGSGASIVWTDENGRTHRLTRNHGTKALQELYEEGGALAEKYKQDLIADAPRLGLDPEEIKAIPDPILEREIAAPLDREAAVGLVDFANIPTVATMNDVERAKVIARRLTPEKLKSLSVTDEGAFDPDFVRTVFGDMTTEERSGLMNTDGTISIAGQTALLNGILAKAYPNSTVLERAAMSADPEIRSIITGLTKAAPEVAKLQAEIDTGARYDLGLAEELSRAAETTAALRKEGRPVAEWAVQADVPGFEQSPIVRQMVQVFDKYKQSPRAIADLIARYVDEAHAAGDPRQGGMFGDAPPPDKGDVWTRALGSFLAEEEIKREAAEAKKKGTGPSLLDDPDLVKAQSQFQKFLAGTTKKGDAARKRLAKGTLSFGGTGMIADVAQVIAADIMRGFMRFRDIASWLVRNYGEPALAWLKEITDRVQALMPEETGEQARRRELAAQELDIAKEKFNGRIREMASRLNSLNPAEIISTSAVLGLAYMKKGAVDFEVFSEMLLREAVGYEEQVRPYLKTIYDTSLRAFNDYVKKREAAKLPEAQQLDKLLTRQARRERAEKLSGSAKGIGTTDYAISPNHEKSMRAWIEKQPEGMRPALTKTLESYASATPQQVESFVKLQEAVVKAAGMDAAANLSVISREAAIDSMSSNRVLMAVAISALKDMGDKISHMTNALAKINAIEQPTAYADLDLKIRKATTEQEKMYDRIAQTKSNIGRSLNALKLNIAQAGFGDIDHWLKVTRRKMGILQGTPLPDHIVRNLNKVVSAGRNATTEASIEALKPRMEAEFGKKYDQLRDEDDYGGPVVKPESKPAPKPRPKFRQKLESAEVEALKEIELLLKGAATTLSAGPGMAAELLAAYAKLGAIKIAKGSLDFADWSREMISAAGERVKPHLDDIWQKSKAAYDEQWKNYDPDAFGDSFTAGEQTPIFPEPARPPVKFSETIKPIKPGEQGELLPTKEAPGEHLKDGEIRPIKPGPQENLFPKPPEKPVTFSDTPIEPVAGFQSDFINLLPEQTRRTRIEEFNEGVRLAKFIAQQAMKEQANSPMAMLEKATAEAIKHYQGMIDRAYEPARPPKYSEQVQEAVNANPRVKMLRTEWERVLDERKRNEPLLTSEEKIERFVKNREKWISDQWVKVQSNSPQEKEVTLSKWQLTPEERAKAMNDPRVTQNYMELAKLLSRLGRTTPLDAFGNYLRVNLLSIGGPMVGAFIPEKYTNARAAAYLTSGSQLGNLLGNASKYTAFQASQLLSAGMEDALSLVSNKQYQARTAGMVRVAKQAALKSLKEFWPAYLEILKYGATKEQLGKMEFSRLQNTEGLLPEKLGKFVPKKLQESWDLHTNSIYGSLGAADLLFKNAVREQVTRSMMEREGLKEPTAAILQIADDIAAEITFNQKNYLADKINSIQVDAGRPGAGLGVKALAGMSSLVMPFVKIPLNMSLDVAKMGSGNVVGILKQGMEMRRTGKAGRESVTRDQASEYAKAKGLEAPSEQEITAAGDQLWNALNDRQKKAFNDALAVGAVSTGLAALAWIGAENGVIVGGKPPSDSGETLVRETVGIPFGPSIRVGNKYIPLSMLGTPGMLMGATAIAQARTAEARSLGKQGLSEITDRTADYGLGMASTVFANPLTQGISDLGGIMSIARRADGDAASPLTRFVAGRVPAAIPGGPQIAQVAAGIDPFKRDVSSRSDTQQLGNVVRRTIPVLRNTLPTRTGAFGKPLPETKGVLGRQFVFDRTSDPVLQEAADRGISVRMLKPGVPKTDQDKADRIAAGLRVDKVLTEEDVQRINPLKGLAVEQAVRDLKESPAYKNAANDHVRSLLMRRVVTAASSKVK